MHIPRSRLLGDDDSWDLFRGKVFGEKEGLDPELERLGRNIARNCKGLPLAISVISGLLSQCEYTEASWEKFVDDIWTAAALEDHVQFSKILSLSYDNLPHHLRPCLLYIGAFSKGAEIRVSRIKRLWAAESFLKQIKNKTAEEAAEKYLEDLANRNFLVVLERKSSGKVKSYGMHDLLKDLCIRRAEQEDFVICSKYVHVTKALEGSIKAESLRRVILNSKSLEKEIYKQFCIDNPSDSPSLLRATRHIHSQEYVMISKLLGISKVLRVLDASEIHFRHECPEEILQLINIRYLSLNCYSFRTPISLLWNLETLIFCLNAPTYIPDELWESPKLKHFKTIGTDCLVTLHSTLETLQTLSLVREENERVGALIKRIPNIKEFGVDVVGHVGVIDLSGLQKLENLKMELHAYSSTITVPPSITKLTLKARGINGNLMRVIGDQLPSLKVLKLQNCSWDPDDEQEWETNEAGFPELHFLELDMDFLDQWLTDDSHFPLLKHLIIRGCFNLEEIPSCIGGIPTLEIMEVETFSASLIQSAKRIEEEQRELSNDGLEVRITRKRSVLLSTNW